MLLSKGLQHEDRGQKTIILDQKHIPDQEKIFRIKKTVWKKQEGRKAGRKAGRKEAGRKEVRKAWPFWLLSFRLLGFLASLLWLLLLLFFFCPVWFLSSMLQLLWKTKSTHQFGRKKGQSYIMRIFIIKTRCMQEWKSRQHLDNIQWNYLHPTQLCFNLHSTCSPSARCTPDTPWVPYSVYSITVLGEVLSFCFGGEGAAPSPPMPPPPFFFYSGLKVHGSEYWVAPSMSKGKIQGIDSATPFSNR